MAIFEFTIGIPYVSEFFRCIVSLIIFHTIVNFTNHSDLHVFGIGGKIFNPVFVWTLVLAALTFIIYHYIVREIVNIY